MKKRITAFILVLVLALGLMPQMAFAESIEDYGGNVNVMIRSQPPHEYLDVNRGGTTIPLSGRIWSYITADGKMEGPAYCIKHGSGYPNGYLPVNTSPYTANPTMTAAFASGYPIVSLADFTASYSDVSGLTEDEYGYATQLAVWAALGQLAVEGTTFTSGAETVIQPSSPEKLRVFNAVKHILSSSGGNGNTNVSGLHIRAEVSELGDTVDLGNSTSLDKAATDGQHGIKKETISGTEYYTREFTVSSATAPTNGKIGMTLSGAPSGTILASASNSPLESSGGTFYAPVSANSVSTDVSASGTEYSCRFKVCVPVSAAEASAAGNLSVNATASASSCTFYLVENGHAYEQDFIIADPNSSTASAAGHLRWGEAGDIPDDPDPVPASIRVLKTDETGSALPGAGFELTGSGGYRASGTTDDSGSITWTDLPADQTYTITETSAPEGYQIADPVNVSVTEGNTSHVTITDATEKKFRVHKQDAQSKTPLEGAVFRFEQIDGSFTTEARTLSDGILEFTSKELPYGSYRVTEISAPEGYEIDPSVKTVHWDGKADVDIYFSDVRKPGFDILKVDAETGSALIGAVFAVYKDGELITTVQTNNLGIATVSGLSEGYYEVEETVAPAGYVLDSTRHGIHIDPYNPATTPDPIIRVTNKAHPALRIVKYDGNTKQPLSNTKFEVYRDSALIGEYVTDAQGEINLYDLEPGTYRVQEVATVSTHVVNSTPQEIELEAGVTETYTLIFLNYVKPGIHLKKLDSRTMQPLANAKFRITQVGGGFSKEFTTDINGEVDLEGLEPGSYTVVELAAPDGYLIDDAERIIKIEAGEDAEFVFTDTRKPSFRLVKIDSLTGDRLAGATFRIAKIEDGSHYLDRVTEVNGEINISDLEPGVYSVQEMMAPEGYVLDSTEYHVELFPGQVSQIVVSNDTKPDLRIVKKDADTGAYLDGATFQVKKADGATLTAEETNEQGEIVLKNMDPGVYEITEQAPPPGYLPAREASQLITLEANKLGTVIFTNYEKPTLTVHKISSVSGEALQGAKFQVKYRSNNTENGFMSDLGYYLTDENGQFKLENLTDGWYTVTEVETVAGYAIRQPATQELHISGGEDVVLTFENTPLSALVVYKYDSVTGEAVAGAKFQVKRLSDTSGTGGTVIGTYTTAYNGSFTVTGLQEGTYIVEEIASDSGHVIDASPQTVYISGKEQDVVEVHFGNAPKGSLMLMKIDEETHAPISGVQFFVTDSDGSIVGDGNGYFTTDSAGTILITGIEPGTTLVAKETRAKAGYILDDTPKTAKILAGQTVTLEFRNAPTGSLLIKKIDSVTRAPLSGVHFFVTDSSGEVIGNGNGYYTTDSAGSILIDGLIPGTSVVAKEVQAKDGYILDDTPQTIKIRSGETVTLEYRNQPKGSLIIVKKDSVTGQYLQGVTFSVKTSAGEYVGNAGGVVTSNGRYVTDSSGQIILTGLNPDTYVVTEEETISGYVLDSTPHSIVVREGDTQTLTLTNKPKGNLVIQKFDNVTKLPLAGAEFRVTMSNGELTDDNEGLTSSTGIYTTDENGQIYLSKLTQGTYVITEVTAPANYKLNTLSRTVWVRAADTQTVNFYDDPLCALTVLKRDSLTKKPLANAEFTVKYSDGTPVGTNQGHFLTDKDGKFIVSGLTPDATVVVTEDKAPTGYIKVSDSKNIVVRSGMDNNLVFENDPATTLIIRKFIDGTMNEPLAGVAFRVVDGSGKAVGPDDGVYYTDHAGEIVIDGLEPGTVIKAREIRTVDGFILDGTPQDIEIKSGEVQQLTFWNKRQGALVIRKLDSVTNEPLEGVTFKITTATGDFVADKNGKVSSNGLYYTDKTGEIILTGLSGTFVVTEVETIPGYTISEATRSQTIVVNPDDTQTLTFYNDPMQTLTIQKYITGTTTPIAGVRFLVTDSSGAVVGTSNGEYITDANGRIVISGLVPGVTVTAKEIETVAGYVLNDTPQSILIKQGEAQTLTFYNAPKGGLIVNKLDSLTREPLQGAEFKITTANGEPVPDNEGKTSTNGIYTTDAYGQIALLKLQPGVYIVTETKAPEGHVLDQTPQTVTVSADDTQTLTFLNDPLQVLTIQKYAEGTTTPIEGVTFLVTDGAGTGIGSQNGQHVTDGNGQIVITDITPGTTVIARETRTVKGYSLNGNPQNIEIQTGQANTLTFYDEPLSTLVIHKYIDGTENEPLSGVGFQVTDGSGAGVGTKDGIYYTDRTGEIVIPDLEPGITVTAREFKTVDGFKLDGTPQDILIKSGDVQELVFWNQRLGTLKIRKLDSVTKEPLAGVEFKVTYADGRTTDTEGGKLSSNGQYFTDSNGEITITGIVGTLVVTEVKAIPGYTLDTNTQMQTVVVRAAETQTLTFFNTPMQTLIIQKYVADSDTPIAGAKFLITDSSGELLGTNSGEYTTDRNGRITITNIPVDTTIIAKEIKAPDGYVLDSTPQSVKIKSGDAQTLTFYNVPKQSLTIYKYVEGTTTPLPGVTFSVTDSSNNPLGNTTGKHITDENGTITISDLDPGTTVIARETRTVKGYTLNGNPQNIEISSVNGNTLTFYDEPLTTLIIHKYIDGTENEPLSGVGFQLTDGNGGAVGTKDGIYYTDKKGEIVVPDLEPGITVTAREIKTVDGFKLDGTPQDILIKSGDVQELVFWNQRLGTLTIRKLDSVTKEPLAGVEFKVTFADGRTVDTEGGKLASNGIYTTNENGEITITGVTGTLVVTEQKTIPGYTINPDSRTQTVIVNANDTQMLTFYNDPTQTLAIQKFVVDSDTPIAGVKFLVTDSSGALLGSANGEYVTDENGRIVVSGLVPGVTVTAKEIRAAEGYVLDSTPKSIQIKSGEAQTLTFYNTPKRILTIQKYEKDTTTPIPGVTFFITDGDGTPLGNNNGEYVTDENGRIMLEGLDPGMTVTAKEVKAADGYVLDGTPKSMKIRTGDAQTLTFYNVPKQSLTIYKYVEGTTTPLPGVTFSVTDANSNPIGSGTYITDDNGAITVSDLTPGTTLVVREIRTVKGYTLNGAPQTIQIAENGNQTVSVASVNGAGNTLAFYDEPLSTLVIHKYIDGTENEPLSGVGFQVTDGSGAGVGTKDGIYYTDQTGEIVIHDLEPGITVTAREFKTVDGFKLDGTPQDILIKSGDVQELVFWNQRLGTLKIRKLDSVTKEPLAGVEFKVAYADGRTVDTEGGKLSSNGVYTTNENGEITITGITGTLVVTEQKTIPGYTINPNSSTQTVVVNANDTQTLTFYNDPTQTLTIQKFVADSDTPIAGVKFLVTDSSGEVLGPNNGEYTTDGNGRIVISGLVPGVTVTARETKAADGYVLDSTPQSIKIKSGEAQALTFYNIPKQSLTIYKYVEGTTTPLPGVTFSVTDAAHNPIGSGTYVTDESGAITISNLDPGTTLIAREVRTVKGYTLNGTPQTIQITASGSQTVASAAPSADTTGGTGNQLVFYDEPLTTLIIHKYIDGTKNEPLSGVGFQLTDNSGAAVGTKDGIYYTDRTGEIVIPDLEPGITVTAREFKAADGFVLDGTPQDILIKSGDVQELVFWNQRQGTLVIRKLDSVTKEPLSGVEFKVTYADGRTVDTEGGKLSSNGIYTTNENGEITITGITGTIVVTEEKTIPGYTINPNSNTQTVIVNPNDTQTLTFYNDPTQTLTIQKFITGTETPLAGVHFFVTDSSGAALGSENGEFVTDENGCIVISGLVPGVTVTAKEVETVEGYALDTTAKSIQIKSGEAQKLTFYNAPTRSLTVQKYEKGTTTPIPGTAFFITDGDGTPVGPNNGEYVTDETGCIVLENLDPGTTITAKEIEAAQGYVLDSTPKSIKIRTGAAQTLTFYNVPKQTFTIQKYEKGTTTPIAGVTFLVTDGGGNPIGSGKGEYTTDENGRISISGIAPGTTVIAREVRTVKGYTLNGIPQNIEIQAGAENILTFYDEPLSTLIIHKYIEGTENEPLSGVAFKVTDSSEGVIGNSNGTFYTDASGDILIPDLEPGITVTVREIQTVNGYVLDGTPQEILIQNGEVHELTFWNAPKQTLTIRKYVTGTTTPIAGTSFLVTDSTGAFVGSNNGEYVTDKNGRIVIDGLTPGVTVTVKEIRAVDGYILDTEPKSVEIKRGTAQTLTFYNDPTSALIIVKRDKQTDKPLKGATFQIMTASGAYVDNIGGRQSSNGIYTTDENGQIIITGLQPDTLVIRETKAPSGYILDDTPQTVQMNANDTQTLTFYNAPTQTLTVQKYIDGTTTPIQGVVFLITDSTGAALGNSTGEFTTDRNGRIVLTDLTPGVTITAKEIRAASGYVLDSTPQSITIKEGEAQALTFYNKADGGLELIKVDAADKTKRISGVTFEIRKMDGALVEKVTTGSDGRVRVNLAAGSYYAVEIETVKGYKLDATPQYFTIQDGKTTTLTVTNTAVSGILLHKTNSTTGKGIMGVTFILYNSANTPIGQYTTDNTGYITIEGLEAGRYYLRELENEGYVRDTEMKTVYVKAGEMTLIEWKNIPITAQIQITKKSADYNPTNGLAAGTLLQGAVFEIYDKAGNLVDTIQSDNRGLAASKPLPLGRYTVKEVKAPANYGINDTVLNAYLEHEGQIVRFEVEDKSLTTGVSITKTGPKEVMAGQPVRYQFSGIGNTSNVRLDSFYWRDTIPAEISLDTVVTGTWNYPGTYKITYRVNGGEPKTLADNLSTGKNYKLAASPVALGLASDQRVTEIMFVFGQAPAGFAQVEAPNLYCTARTGLTTGSFVNVADVGGVYNGQWVQGVSRWVTNVYGKPTTTLLPRTGY